MADEVAAEAARSGSVWSLLSSAAVRSELTLGAVAGRRKTYSVFGRSDNVGMQTWPQPQPSASGRANAPV